MRIGIASVTANTFDQAQRARDALRITWNAGPNDALSDAQIFAKLDAATPPFAVPALGAQTIDRTFRFAFAPHAPLEVWNCVADVRADSDKAHATKAAFDFDLLTSAQSDPLASPMLAAPTDAAGLVYRLGILTEP